MEAVRTVSLGFVWTDRRDEFVLERLGAVAFVLCGSCCCYCHNVFVIWS